MPGKDRVSVVIPSRDRPQVLKRLLDSYLSQPAVEEVIIVDDGSKEELAQALREFGSPKLKCFRNEESKGSPFARNLGMMQASGEFILQSDDDVLLSEDYVETSLAHLKANQADVLGGRRIYLRQGESIEAALERANKLRGEPFDAHAFLVNSELPFHEDQETPFLQATMLFRKKVFERTGGYDEAFKEKGFREENDFHFKALENGFKVMLCPHAVSFHLPRGEVYFGGQYGRSRLNYLYWSVKNHFRFLDRHHATLNKVTGLQRSLFAWKADFLFYTFEMPFKKLFRLVAKK